MNFTKELFTHFNPANLADNRRKFNIYICENQRNLRELFCKTN